MSCFAAPRNDGFGILPADIVAWIAAGRKPAPFEFRGTSGSDHYRRHELRGMAGLGAVTTSAPLRRVDPRAPGAGRSSRSPWPTTLSTFRRVRRDQEQGGGLGRADSIHYERSQQPEPAPASRARRPRPCGRGPCGDQRRGDGHGGRHRAAGPHRRADAQEGDSTGDLAATYLPHRSPGHQGRPGAVVARLGDRARRAVVGRHDPAGSRGDGCGADLGGGGVSAVEEARHQERCLSRCRDRGRRGRRAGGGRAIRARRFRAGRPRLRPPRCQGHAQAGHETGRPGHRLVQRPDGPDRPENPRGRQQSRRA